MSQNKIARFNYKNDEQNTLHKQITPPQITKLFYQTSITK